MKINLNEIPEEGRSFDFERKDGKLNDTLFDLVGSKPYEFHFKILPLGGAYEVKGNGQSEVTELCSRCGWDLEIPIRRKIHEYIVIEEERPRGSKAIQGNQSLNLAVDGPETTYVHSSSLNLSEFLHEQLALAIPLYPECRTQACIERSEEFMKKLAPEPIEVAKGHPAFSVLQKVKT